MINVTVVNLKTIIKYFIMLLILCIFGIKQIFEKSKQIGKEFNNRVPNISFISCIKSTLPNLEKNKVIEEKNVAHSNTTSRSLGLRKILKVELQMLDTVREDGEEDEVYGTVKIKNESNKEITQEILTPNISLENKKDVIIFHTHTCESYTTSEKFNYEMTGSYRTTDLNFSVARVGTELEKQLKEYGFLVTHDTTYHDYPEYSGSYGKSLETVKNILNSKPDTQMVIDLHRDAVGSKPEYAPSVQIGDETAAQMMFVIGTDGGGLQHLNWQQNLKFAVKVQQKADELYTGLFRPIIVRNSRYNQHLTKASTIIEVGATGNTMEQCLVSMKYLARILNEVNK